jgi:DNA-directed RNA polymerase subunit RPC12/RpoP
MSFDLSRPLVMCRQASDPLLPGYKTGYACVECGKPLQVSPSGVPVIANKGGQPICNACGKQVLEAARFSEARTDIVIGPDAVESIQRQTGEPIGQTFPNATKIWVK